MFVRHREGDVGLDTLDFAQAQISEFRGIRGGEGNDGYRCTQLVQE